MDSQILVAYATKYSATEEIAEKIGQVLRQAGLSADVLPAERVSNLSPYKAVVLGGAVYVGRWRKNAATFLAEALGHKIIKIKVRVRVGFSF